VTPATLTASPLTPYPLKRHDGHSFQPAPLPPLGDRSQPRGLGRSPPPLSGRHPVPLSAGRDGAGRWVASLKRSPRDRAQTASLPAHLGPDAAVAHLIGRLGLPWRALPAAGSVDGGETYCYVMELGEGGEALGLAAGERAALALEACRTLEAAAAGGATAEALALPVALARMATGTDRPRRVITGVICRGDGVAVTDHLGREVCRMPGRCSMAGALAAAAAAGWPLGAAAAATAARLQGPPDPEAVALALEARGGCPAVIATLKGVAS
jgi:hypothetical protein